ncbi:hypothetical protein D6158_04055 [Nocardia seriolae]|nr:hypothetical protein C6575_03220 [Nocardia seriolae]RLP33101.1 hypothetical protein D6158_04055 [Nocardia seriolae]
MLGRVGGITAGPAPLVCRQQYGVDPAITGESSEERRACLRQHGHGSLSRTERVSPSQLATRGSVLQGFS